MLNTIVINRSSALSRTAEFQTTHELLGKSGNPSLLTNVSSEEFTSLFLTAFQNKVNDIRKNLDNLTSDIFSVEEENGSIYP